MFLSIFAKKGSGSYYLFGKIIRVFAFLKACIFNKTDLFSDNFPFWNCLFLSALILKFQFWQIAATFSKHLMSELPQLAQQCCGNVVTMSLLTLSRRCGTVKNESCADVSFRCCDNVAVRCYQDFARMLLQRRHKIKHWVSRPFYYGLF